MRQNFVNKEKWEKMQGINIFSFKINFKVCKCKPLNCTNLKITLLMLTIFNYRKKPKDFIRNKSHYLYMTKWINSKLKLYIYTEVIITNIKYSYLVFIKEATITCWYSNLQTFNEENFYVISQYIQLHEFQSCDLQLWHLHDYKHTQQTEKYTILNAILNGK